MAELFCGKSKEKLPISYETGSFLVRGTGLEPVTPCTSIIAQQKTSGIVRHYAGFNSCMRIFWREKLQNPVLSRVSY